jgi:hypothetical protein
MTRLHREGLRTIYVRKSSDGQCEQIPWQRIDVACGKSLPLLGDAESVSRPAIGHESRVRGRPCLSDNGLVLNIEGLAVSAETDILALCPDLHDQITVNDKTPVTDGHIDLYKSGNHSNTNLIGRVFVQVKGRTTCGKARLATWPIWNLNSAQPKAD